MHRELSAHFWASEEGTPVEPLVAESRLQIRHATADDAEQIAQVHTESWRRGYAGIFPEDYLASLDWHTRAQSWQQILSGDEPAYVLVATRSGIVVGFAGAGPSRDDDLRSTSAELYALYVGPDAWRDGVASALLEHVLLDHPHESLMVWVLTLNHVGRGFYEHHGFRDDGARTHITRGNAVADTMRYRLSRQPAHPPK